VTKTIDLSRPWKGTPYRDLVAAAAEADSWNLTIEGRRARCRELGVENFSDMEDYEISQQVFENRVEEKTINPVLSLTFRKNWHHDADRSGVH